MTYWMDDPRENRRALQNLGNPLDGVAIDPGPAPFEGAGGALVTGAEFGIDALATAAGDAVIPYLQDIATPLDEMMGSNAVGWMEQRRLAAHDSLRSNRLDPNTVGEVGQILHGASSVITQALVGGLAGGAPLAALAAGGGTGYAEYNQLVESGIDSETAKRMAGITALDTAVGVAIPMSIGGGLLGAAAWGVGTNVALGAVGRYDSGKVLAEAGYADMAEQYKAFDGMAMATDVLMGAAFPAAGKIAEMTRSKLTPEQLDAVDVAARTVHEGRELSPGLHRTPDSANAHVEALDKMESEVLANGKNPNEVDLSAQVARMDMEPDVNRQGVERRADDRGTGAREGERRIREPHEILRDEFEARARAAGLTEDIVPNARAIIDELAPRQEVDSATGWNNLQGKKFLVQEVVKDAMAVAEETGQSVHYVSLDLQNLGGLNAFFDEVYSQSDAEFKAIMGIMREELDKVGGKVYMRTGGDELSTVVSGADTAKIQGALDKSFVRIKDYAAERGYGDIDHAKGKPVKGVNVYGGFQEIRPGMSIGKIIDAADAAMGIKKQSAIDNALAAQMGAQDGNGSTAEAPRNGAAGRKGQADNAGPAKAPRPTDGGTGEGSEPARPPVDPSDPAAVARAGDIGSIDQAAVDQALAALPDMRVPDPDNPGKTIGARELLARIDDEIATAQQDVELSNVAVACFMTFKE